MSAETMEWLNTNTLIGFTERRGNAWHYRAEMQGELTNHYPGAIPIADAKKRIFGWEPMVLDLAYTIPEYMDETGVYPARTIVDENEKLLIHPRSGELLGKPTDKYEIHSYTEWLLNAVSTILGDTLMLGSCGLLMKGAIAWAQFEMPDSITTPEGVEFRPHLLSTTSLNGKLATTYKRCVTDVVCDNTRAIAMSEKGQEYKVKHTRNSGIRIADAREALAMVHTTAEEFENEVKTLCETPINKRQFTKFLDMWAPIPKGDDATKRALNIADKKRSELTGLWNGDKRVEPWKGTAYAVMQAVNTWNQHFTQVRDGNGGKNGAARGERTTLNALNGTLERETADTFEMVKRLISA